MQSNKNSRSSFSNISGVFPHLCIGAQLGPPRSECGVGALMPWADRLWVVAYVSSGKKSGVGTGLYEIDPEFNITQHPESRVGTFTNRFVHVQSNQLVFGPHVIDSERNVRTVQSLLNTRLCATMAHLDDPQNKVYVLGMEGEFFELDIHSLETRLISDLTRELELPGPKSAHFKAGYTYDNRVVVASNTYEEEEFLGKRAMGRLAQWDGESWRIIERSPFVEVTGRGDFSKTMFASGWDRASAILKLYTRESKTWKTYRLPKASHTFDHWWQTEWPRIRETEHERFLMDCHGMFYELSPWAYGGHIWGVRPISTHLWVLGDFCSWQGMLVMGSDNASPAGEHNPFTGEPQSNLWFGRTDDLWSLGKPSGWGGPWHGTDVTANQPSDPYLMTGFDKKCLHLTHDAGKTVNITIEVDFLGNGAWHAYADMAVPANGYIHHEFPQAFSAHWARVVADTSCTATAMFMYT